MITDYAAEKIINNITGRNALHSGAGTTLVVGSISYVGLSATTPNKDGTGFTEPEGGGYQRVLLGVINNPITYKMGNAENSESKNPEEIHFNEVTEVWGTLTHFLIFNDKEGGELIAYDELTTPITPSVGSIPMIRANELIIKFT